jgi:hypothetical protein
VLSRLRVNFKSRFLGVEESPLPTVEGRWKCAHQGCGKVGGMCLCLDTPGSAIALFMAWKTTHQLWFGHFLSCCVVFMGFLRSETVELGSITSTSFQPQSSPRTTHPPHRCTARQKTPEIIIPGAGEFPETVFPRGGANTAHSRSREPRGCEDEN